MALYLQQSIPSNIDPTPSSTPTTATVTVGTTAVQILAANANRKGFSFYNNSNRTIYLGTANSVSATQNFFAVVPPNTLYEWSLNTMYVGAIFAIANQTGGSVLAFELTP